MPMHRLGRLHVSVGKMVVSVEAVANVSVGAADVVWVREVDVSVGGSSA